MYNICSLFRGSPVEGAWVRSSARRHQSLWWRGSALSKHSWSLPLHTIAERIVPLLGDWWFCHRLLYTMCVWYNLLFCTRTLGSKPQRPLVLVSRTTMAASHSAPSCWFHLPGSGVPRGGGRGGHGPRAQALEGAPAQLVGPNCNKKSRPRQISKVTSLQSAVGGGGGANSGGGRCKHWPPGAGDPRYATATRAALHSAPLCWFHVLPGEQATAPPRVGFTYYWNIDRASRYRCQTGA